MARLNINPTRMELRRLKTRLSTAVRGHKLLKDKSDEMIRVFSIKLRENKLLRQEVEQDVSDVFRQFAMARSNVSLAQLELAFAMPSTGLSVECDKGSIMGVEVPKLDVEISKSRYDYPYSFAAMTSEADYSIKKVNELMEKLLRLAELEKTTRMLADEIEKNKRRVNALEYVMIPQLEETIKYITIKLDENERGNLARLMKVKSMLETK